MKRFYSKKAKILLAIACIFFAMSFFISAVAYFVIFDSSMLGYDEFRKNIYESAGNAYAALALSKYDSDFNAGLLNNMDCYYGIIEGEVTDDTDLNNNETYVYRNFDGISVPDIGEYYTYTTYINDKTVYNIPSRMHFWYALGQEMFTQLEIDPELEEVVYEIEGLGFDPVDKKAYVFANGEIYSLGCYIWSKDYLLDNEVDEVNDTSFIYKTMWKDGKYYYENVGYDPVSNITPGYMYLDSEHRDKQWVVSGDYVADLTPIHRRLEEANQFSLLHGIKRAYPNDASSIKTIAPEAGTKFYTFICFPNEAKLSANGYYAQAKKIADVTNKVKPFIPILSITFLIIALVCFVIFIKAAGHNGKSEEIMAGPIEKMPIETVLLAGGILEFFFIVLSHMIVRVAQSEIWPYVFGLCMFLTLLMVVFLIFCSTLAVNIKLHRLRENSIILGLLMKIDWKKRIWIVYVAVPMILFMITLFLYRIFNAGSDEKVLAAFLGVFMDKAVLAVFIFWGIRSYSKIKDAAEKLAKGDTTARADVAGMPQFFEDTGNAINEIQSGFEIALAEQTKSERMRTELITNVSHDIKTPITSIINYVDLLGKENIESEKVNEYLEVLNRQSLRLKKLVEDIIEAAKITTGNINLNMEEVDAKVLLDQSIGEFAERLKEKQIEVVVSSSEEKMMLLADNRYLWRVFDNIMSNIVKYAKADTRAYVDLKKEDDKLRFIFRNTSREQLNITPDELMERFVRGDKSRYTDGNGLGLSIASSLTKAMGGSMNLTIDGDFFKVILEFDVIDKNEG